MAKGKLEEQLAALGQLEAESAIPILQKALGGRSNVLVAKAAQMCARFGLRPLIPDLEAALNRFYENAVATDPQCRAKQAIVRALRDLDYREHAVYERGMKHEQWEAVWGRKEDTAGAMRCACLQALPNTDLPALDVVKLLAEALVDHDKSVRAEVPLALGHLNSALGTPLLRYKALLGDVEPEVTGNALRALLSIEGEQAMPIVGKLLAELETEASLEAALALVESRVKGAFELVARHWEQRLDEEHRLAIATALGGCPDERSFALLERIAGQGSARVREAARGAMLVSRFR